MQLDFIIIDDNELDCFIAKKLLIRLIDQINLTTFLTAKEGFNHVCTNKTDANLTIIFLDLMLPEMNGFNFIEAFEKLPVELQNKYFIVVMTSSMNRTDISQLKRYIVVQEILDKPLTVESIKAAIRLATIGFRKTHV